MPLNRMKYFFLMSIGLALLCGVNAAPIHTFETGPNAVAVADDDLLQTSLASDDWQENNNIHNGTTGTSDENSGSNPASVTSPGTYDFELDLTQSPDGYDISQIDSFSGWSDNRAGQAYTIFFSTVGDPSFTQITPSEISVGASNESLVTHVFDDAGALLGTGVDVIRFEVGVNGNENVWREIDVIGVPSLDLIESFTVSPGLIAPGAALTLEWEVDPSVTAVSIDQGVGDVTALTNANGVGSVTVDPGPLSSMTFQLLAETSSESRVEDVAVVVTDQPIIHFFTADAGIVPPGTAVTLTWETDNAVSVFLNGNDVTGQSGLVVTLSAQSNYVLTASNANGTSSEELYLQVISPGEVIISEFMAENDGTLIDEDGDESDWIELYNPTAITANLDGYYLTDDSLNLSKWRLPAVTVAPGEYLIVFASGKARSAPASELHSNFRLSASGEYLALVKPNGVGLVTEFAPTYPEQRPDISFGIDTLGFQRSYFLSPTPGEDNIDGFAGFVEDTSFSFDRGFYDTAISVEITTETAGAQIFYTLDGTPPTESNGIIYTEQIPISETTVLRAAAFKAGLLQTNIDTHTYIFPLDVIEQPSMDTDITEDPVFGPQMVDSLQAVPTISLVFEGGIDRTEKAASVELINFEAGSMQLDAGMERFGNRNTNFTKRSLRLTFRRIYGPGKLEFPVFDGHDYPIPPAAQFDAVELRSGGHDMSQRGAYMSNRFTDDTMMDMGQIAPHGRFVHVYINGLYWGQYHLRERWNAAMFSEYFGGGEEDYEAINANDNFAQDLAPYDGTGEFWEEAEELVEGAQPFANAASHIDMANYTDFMLLYVSGRCESEFRSAGSRIQEVPYKFFMKDADGYLRSPTHSVTDPGPLDLITILANEADPDYKTLLADRIHKHYFNDGAFTPAEAIERLDERVAEIETSFISESARWGEHSPDSWRSFQDNLITNHFPSLTGTMIGRFESAGMYPDLDAPSFSQHGGAIPLGFQLDITAPTGTIYYTTDGSDPRQSIADGGTGNGSISSTAVVYNGVLPLTEPITEVQARVFDGENWSALNASTFVQDLSSLVISEIMYDPSPPTPDEIAAGYNEGEDFQFIELYNTGTDSFDLSGLQFTEGITFDFNTGSISSLAAGARLLIVEDLAAFEFRYGTGLPVAGVQSGKLNDGGETLTLVNGLGQTLHSFTYDNNAPWPSEAAGLGASLVLIDPSSLPDHDQAASWAASSITAGTPGGASITPQSYADFTNTFGIGGELEDPDGDGISNLLEFILGSSPIQSSLEVLPVAGVQTLTVAGEAAEFLTLSYTYNIAISGLTSSAQVSSNLTDWNEGTGSTILMNTNYHGDGTATVIYRSETPVGSTSKEFIRAFFEITAP